MKKLLLLIILYLSAGIAKEIKFSALAFCEHSYSTEEAIEISNKFEFHHVYFTFQKKLSDTFAFYW